MQTTHAANMACAALIGCSREAKHRFRVHFKSSLRACLRKRFTLEESFGLVFTETLLEVPLAEQEEAQLYLELLDWATKSSELSAQYSVDLFTGLGR